MKKLRHILFLCLLNICFHNVYGQMPLTKRAYTEYSNKNFKQAKAIIDSAVLDNTEKSNIQTWQLRGFIYREHFKAEEKDTALLSTALASFDKARSLDTENKQKEDFEKSINVTLNKFFNKAVFLLKNQEVNGAIKYYKSYKTNFNKYLAQTNHAKGDIEFYNAVATHFNKKHQSGEESGYDNAIYYYEKVLEIDSMDYNANYNLGVLYYNNGVRTIFGVSPEADIKVLIDGQDEGVDLFKKAYPYVNRAYQLKPNRLEPIEALSGICLNLNDLDQYEKFNQEIKNLIDHD